MKKRYRPRRLLRRPRRAPGAPRRLTALLLCLALALALLPRSAWAAGYSAVFYNYDMSPMAGAGYSYGNVPEGAALYTAEELEGQAPGFVPQAGCTWYLYHPGGGEEAPFGPHAIPDPPARQGYTFRDWAVRNAAQGNIHTVLGDTVYVARYLSDSRYIISLYYQYDNESHTVAAETDTAPFGWEEPVEMALPDGEALAGLSPAILPALEGAEAQAAAEWLSGALKPGGDGYTFECMVNDQLLENCRAAGFLAWDEASDAPQTDENGNVQLSIPITYQVAGEIGFRVEYLLQNADGGGYAVNETAERTVTGTTQVSLSDLGLVKSYEGFTLTAASAEDAERYTVSADGSTVIQLKYDRNIHYILYRMDGGTVREPLALRYGQAIPDSVLTAPDRAGYSFTGWTWLDGEGSALAEAPAAMPDHDLTLAANWTAVENGAEVTLVYWLENANDDGYTVSGQRTISVTAGKTIGYRAGGSASTVDVDISPYLTPEAMAAAGIPDGAYFTFAYADASTQYPAGGSGGPKTVAGDGSTVVNLGFERNEYTLIFHLGRDTWLGYYVANGGYSTATAPNDWQSGFTEGFLPLGGAPELVIGGKTYPTSDDPGDWYQITAKYGAFISGQWPSQDHLSSGGWFGFRDFYGWGAHALSPYAKSHPGANSVINGIYSTMSADLIVYPEHPEVEHHLTAYYQWNFNGYTLTYHHMFEVVPGVGETGTSFSGSVYDGYASLSGAEAGKPNVQGRQFYEYGNPMTISSLQSAAVQNAPDFSNLTYQYGCYSGDDIYFFYTYNDYSITYHENNPNLQPGAQQPAGTQTKWFHYAGGAPLSQQLTDYDYTPRAYVSQYGNAYAFGGWYLDAEFQFPVDWESAPASSFEVYARWIAPTFTLTLIVPGGTLYPATLEQFEELGYTVAVSTAPGEDGTEDTTYTVSGIPGGIPASQIVSQRQGALSGLGLEFDYWGYEVNGAEQPYLFDESQYVTSDLTLTARWKTEYTGQYVVRHLAGEDPRTGLGGVTVDGQTWYRLTEDETVTNVAVGSSVTVAAAAVDGWLARQGQLTRVVAAAEGGQPVTYFDFFYDRIAGNVTYTVHYVLDKGEDYGRTAPPAGAVSLAEDKTVTVPRASLDQSTSVSESAPPIGGYSPRDGWTATFALAGTAEENHLYFYYVPNTYEVDFRAVYHFPDGEELDFALRAALGRVLTAGELTGNYRAWLAEEDAAELEAALVGRELDETLTDPWMILTQAENIYHIHLRDATYALTYRLHGTSDLPARWPEPDPFLEETADGDYAQAVTYPNGASVPGTSPVRLGHTFLGWSETPDGQPLDLAAHPWYQPEGMTADHEMHALWQAQLTVTYDLRGGQWNAASGDAFFPDGEDWFAYVDLGGAAPRPADPSLVQSGTAYAFVGWTATDPDGAGFIGPDGRVDLDEFNSAYCYSFTEPVDGPLRLYAVWDPDVTGVELYKTDGGGTPLAGASFTLERVLTTVTAEDGGYTFDLPSPDAGGSWPIDPDFPARSLTTGGDGGGRFENLPAGYYLLTETQAPEGYGGLEGPALLFLPYGDGEPELALPADNVAGAAEGGDLALTVVNVARYQVEIDVPAALTLTYAAPDLIWDPEKLAYEPVGGQPGRWTVAAEGADSPWIAVTNRSPAGAVAVEVALTYREGYQALLPLSSLTGGEDGFTEERDTDSLTLTGSLASGQTARFSLLVEGPWDADPAALPPAGQAGTITVVVTHPRRLNSAWQ